MKLLEEEEYHATFSGQMKRVDPERRPPFDFWDYVDAIPPADYQGFDCSERSVTYVWETEDGGVQHVFFDSEDKDVFMVVVLDVVQSQVIGHRLLNLPVEYGLKAPPLQR